jgi:hypothetical protein
MVTYVYEDEQVSVPSWVVDLASFRRWADSNEFPENGRIWWLKGEVWVDMSRQQIFSHLAIKNEYAYVLTGLVKAGTPGLFLPDGLFLCNVHADIAGNPDGTFVSNKALESGDVRLIEGKQGGYLELEGSPDMVLEVISISSVHKDTVTMRQAYWEASIREYWLVDARREPLKFDILRHTAKGYAATRKQDGWMKSAVFGKSFRLTQRVNQFRHPEYTLEVR